MPLSVLLRIGSSMGKGFFIATVGRIGLVLAGNGQIFAYECAVRKKRSLPIPQKPFLHLSDSSAGYLVCGYPV